MNMLNHRRLLVLALSAIAACADPAPIAGYTPLTDVVQHSRIDLDQKQLSTAADFTGDNSKKTAYTTGGNSVKSSGSIRTLQGFSTGLDAKACPGGACIEPMYERAKTYWTSPTYADAVVLAALEATGDYAGKEDSMRKEVAVKVSAYMVAGMYAIHEMEDAIADCKAGALNNNDAGVHAWDEAVAFYAGSLEGEAVGGNSAGQMYYRVAEKRCKNFGTCADHGGVTMSNVNANIMAAFETGKVALNGGDCDAGAAQMAIIKAQMLVPAVQGTLRYAFKTDMAVEANAAKSASTKAKEIGEGWAFLATILAEVDHCDPAVATKLRDNLDVAAPTAMKDGHAAVLAELQKVYTCLGITCADVGGLLKDETKPGEYHDSYGPCIDPSTAELSADSLKATAGMASASLATVAVMTALSAAQVI